MHNNIRIEDQQLNFELDKMSNIYMLLNILSELKNRKNFIKLLLFNRYKFNFGLLPDSVLNLVCFEISNSSSA